MNNDTELIFNELNSHAMKLHDSVASFCLMLATPLTARPHSILYGQKYTLYIHASYSVHISQ